MKKTFLYFAILLISFLATTSCKKEFDTPPVKQIGNGSFINIAGIKAKYTSNINYTFKSDSNLYCVVTADEVSGNLYKDIYVKDVTGALHVKLINSGGLFVGDSIRINLKGVILNEYNKLIQLDSVDTEKSIVKLASGYNPSPIVMTIAQINANTAATNSVQSKLVRIENAEFISADQNQAFADPIGKASLNRIIKTCNGQTLTVRTSGYSSFAAKLTPSGNGSIIGIVSQFGTTMQLTLRNVNEVNMNAALCAGTTTAPSTGTFVIGASVSSINETFSSQTTTNNPIALSGWINYDETGTKTWLSDVSSGNYRAKATSFGTNSDAQNKIWLISPPINASATPTLSFKTAMAFPVTAQPSPFTVWISKSFNGTNLTSASTWTNITSATIAPLTGANYAWVNSGTINLSSFLSSGYTGTYFIAFKYYGNKPSNYTTNYYIDDILIQ